MNTPRVIDYSGLEEKIAECLFLIRKYNISPEELETEILQEKPPEEKCGGELDGYEQGLQHPVEVEASPTVP